MSLSIKHQTYILGQVYGYIKAITPEWNFGGVLYPLTYPLNAVTQALIGALRTGKMKLDDDFVGVRLAEISPDYKQPVHDNDLQGSFVIGEHQYNRDIKEVIDSTGLTQEEIAERLGVTRLTVGRWYRGETHCSASMQFKVECLWWEQNENKA